MRNSTAEYFFKFKIFWYSREFYPLRVLIQIILNLEFIKSRFFEKHIEEEILCQNQISVLKKIFRGGIFRIPHFRYTRLVKAFVFLPISSKFMPICSIDIKRSDVQFKRYVDPWNIKPFLFTENFIFYWILYTQ